MPESEPRLIRGCWVAALVTARVWPGPELARVVPGLTLASQQNT